MKSVIITLSQDRARDLELLLLAGGYHFPPKSDASLSDRLEHEVTVEVLKQIKEQQA